MDVTAIILTCNDPVRLNACVWSVALQTASARLREILIVNTGAWVASNIGASLDIISEIIPVTLTRVANGTLGAVHASAFAIAAGKIDTPYVWFFQDDAVADYLCLETLLKADVAAAVPVNVYPDFAPSDDVERQQLPQQVSGISGVSASKEGKPLRGPILGILFESSALVDLATTVQPLTMGIDEAMCRVLRPTSVPGAGVFHTRPENPHWDRIVPLVTDYISSKEPPR